MYLSRVMIDVLDHRKIRKLTNLEVFHSWVEHCFPDEMQRGERSRKLWRIDKLQGNYYLLIVSKSRPDEEVISEYGVADTVMIKSYDAFLSQLSEGMRARFKVTLNPVMSKFIDGETRGQVLPHVTIDQQRHFLLDRAEKNGFTLNEYDFTVTHREFVPLKKGSNAVKVSKVTYEGMLTISDIEQFNKTLTQGFGKKKAYGCGLMTIIPE